MGRFSTVDWARACFYHDTGVRTAAHLQQTKIGEGERQVASDPVQL